MDDEFYDEEQENREMSQSGGEEGNREMGREGNERVG
jgi:hypothetical protein